MTFPNIAVRFLEYIKGKEFDLGSFLYTAFSIIIIRTVLESMLENEHFITLNSSFYYILVDYCHVSISWFTLFFFIVLLLHYFSGDSIKDTCKVSLFAFPLIILVPILDFFVFESGTIVYNYSFNNFVYSFTNTLNPFKTIDFVTFGVRIEIFLVLFFSSIYVYIQTKSVLRTLGVSLFIYILIFIFGYLPAIYNLFFSTTLQEILHSSILPIKSDVHYNFYIYLPFLLIIVLSVFNSATESIRRTLIDSFRLSRLTIYLGLLSLGILVAIYDNGILHDISSIYDISKVSVAFLSVTTAFSYSVILNNIKDIEIDKITNRNRPLVRKLISLNDYITIRNMMFLSSCVFALSVNEQFFTLTVFSLVLSYVYSAEPIRLRNHFITANTALATIGIISFLLGVTIVEANMAFINVNKYLLGFIFCYFFVAANVKDIKDVKGDEAKGISTLPILIGSKRTLLFVKIIIFGLTLTFCSFSNFNFWITVAILTQYTVAAFTLTHSEKYLVYTQINLGLIFLSFLSNY